MARKLVNNISISPKVNWFFTANYCTLGGFNWRRAALGLPWLIVQTLNLKNRYGAKGGEYTILLSKRPKSAVFLCVGTRRVHSHQQGVVFLCRLPLMFFSGSSISIISWPVLCPCPPAG